MRGRHRVGPALSLVTAAIVHWNTVCLNLAARRLRADGVAVPDDMLAHVASLGLEHISLTGDCDWATASPPPGGFRPLRDVHDRFLAPCGFTHNFGQIARCPRKGDLGLGVADLHHAQNQKQQAAKLARPATLAPMG